MQHCLAKQNYDSFKMNDDELIRDMYSHLNLIINELHSIGLTKLDDVDIMWKIIFVLPQKKYASIITILHNMEDLSTMTSAIAIGKIVAFEMSRKMGQEEASSSSKGKALACGKKKKMKGKQVETSSSSSSSSEDEEEDSCDDDQSSSSTFDLDEESIKLINKVEKMIQRLNVKGVPIQIQDLIFTNQRNEQRKRGCYDAASWGTLWKFVQISPHPRQRRRHARTKPSHQ